jgi:hypothetical protein
LENKRERHSFKILMKSIQLKKLSQAIITATLAGLFAFNGYGQKDRVLNLANYENSTYHFGFTLGLNQMNFTIKPAADLHYRVYDASYTPELAIDSSMLLSVNSEPVMGFNIGIIGDMRLGRYFSMRFVPALSFGERYIHYSILGYNNGETELIDIRKSVTSGFVDFPLLFKYKSKRLNNMLAYLTAGAQYSLDLASGAKKKDDNQETHVKLEKHDVYIVVGVGFDFFNPWFKFGTELKMSYGLLDMLKKEENIYSQGIDRLNSKVFQLCFTFE